MWTRRRRLNNSTLLHVPNYKEEGDWVGRISRGKAILTTVLEGTVEGEAEEEGMD